MLNTPDAGLPAYKKPSIKSYTEAEVLAAMEAWGVSGGGATY